MTRFHAWAAALACLLALEASAQDTMKITADDYARAAKLIPQNANPLLDHAATRITWLDAGRFWYIDHDADGDRFLIHDVASGETVPAFDQTQLAKALSDAGDKPVRAGKLPVTAFTRRDDGRYDITAGGKDYLCDLDGDRGCIGKSSRKTADGQPWGREPGVRSPDGRREAFVRDWNLWLRDLDSGAETQLTTDGEPDYGYATDNAGWKHSDKAILVWSPDSSMIATFRQDQRQTSTMTLVETNVGEPKVQQWKYPLAGDEHVILIERVIIEVAPKRLVRLQMPPDPHRSTCSDDIVCDDGWADVQWAADGNTLAFVSTDRGHKSATLRVADAASGAVRDVYTETVATQYQSAPTLGPINWRYLPESGEFLWFSQKSDWGHLYLHDLASGKEKRQITHGAWNVTEIVRMDPAGRRLWVTGVGREVGRDPYFVHLYQVGIDDGEVRLLTPEDANHAIVASPDGGHFVDTYSTIASAPVSVLRDAEGRVVRQIAQADLTRLQAAGWVAPESFTVKARDGKTGLYGQMFKPGHFDPGNRYPLIVYIYPGPQVGSVRSRNFMAAHLDHQALAELGFVVIALDGMGTPLRSKSFQDAYYGNMIDNTLPDQVAAVKQLAARHPWIDPERVGIWGHSGGGNATATAMFRYPEVFKVGIAESGNHDNLSYEDDWAERYHGLREAREDGGSNYSGQDNASFAHNLQGKLLLIHGTLDDNVPPYMTLLVADALIKANKDFDLLMIPNARHGYGTGATGAYVMRRRWDYFVRNLMGAEPPDEFEMPLPKP
ncbi:S9 family peptidase [Pseudoxanthomonas kalamensis DSM 18571]|uniref:S9 family peptidase n=1 Tax=Pseudoxanthomonas kalamensis TaxID=289483 RepID=UPI001391AB10|nr:DPP IV N-terminal domain-containing protein [Pseudoxanthomonas kalamensis]KAF1712207.1 S9 family peptidase [Pseudoxanthomonas kalamensis DSM 18571]